MINYKTSIEAAAKRSRPHIRHTPLEHSPYLSSLAEANVFLKLDNIQKTGSFKFRGAISKITSLNDKEKSNGVVTASTGNHGAACSLAMSELGIEGNIVVPENVQHRKLDDIKPGGLGTFFIKQIMDNAVFKKDQDGWVNHLVLTKKI